jgi:REP element-mobilizing transposase RayT
MPKPRRQSISLACTPYYHCISRCVRKAYLCGQDNNGRSYSHRRSWLEKKLGFLARVFAIDLCAYAVMHNHYHVVLHVNSINAKSWSDNEVIKRWHQIFQGTELSNKYLKGDQLTKEGQKTLAIQTKIWRDRLMSISWFMRVINERLARKANQEDNCSGRFWEGRFKAQALLDEKGLIACMAYVDLNPIRAKLAKKPEESNFTSIKKRIEYIKKSFNNPSIAKQPNALFPFIGNTGSEENLQGLPFHLEDYLLLLDWTGRALYDKKYGTIPNNVAPILLRLNIEPTQWLLTSKHFESRFPSLVGMVISIKVACTNLNQHWAHGISSARLLFG